MMPRQVTGKHVLWGIIAFFGVIFLANGVFIFLALDSFSGMAAENPYIRGLEYQEDRERSRQWRVTIDQTTLKGNAIRLSVRVADPQGRPVRQLAVEAEIRRPTNDRHDKTITLAPQSDGTYTGEIVLAALGRWNVRIQAREGERVLARAEKRLWIAP